jgi:C4-dicarboxylate transporter DctM subunit
MTGVEFGFMMFGVMLVLLAIRVPIGLAMLLTGAAGYVTLAGWLPFANYLKSVAYSRFSVYDLSVIPMFLLMGQFASRGGLSKSLFNAANAIIGHWRGGVAMAAVGACAGFGAICGSSLATAATMGQVALPELRRLKYEPALATATLAAGGTLGILIRPRSCSSSTRSSPSRTSPSCSWPRSCPASSPRSATCSRSRCTCA